MRGIGGQFLKNFGKETREFLLGIYVGAALWKFCDRYFFSWKDAGFDVVRGNVEPRV